VSIVLSIFSQDILPIFAVAAAGFLLARRFGANVRTLSTITFNALSPCLVFDQIVASKVGLGQSLRVVLFCVLLTFAMGIVARLAAVPLKLTRTSLISFLLVAMFSNSGNYALPVVLFAFGQESLAFASVYFVTSAVLVYTFGVFVAGSGRAGLGASLAGVLRVPAFYAVLAAVVVLATNAVVPVAIARPVTLLGDAAIPMMLLVLGMQLERATKPTHPAAVVTAVVLSLVVSPVFAFGLSYALGLAGAARQAAIVEASMPAAVITTVLALEYDLDTSFSTGVVMLSTLLSPFTLVFLIAYLQRTAY
jgi:predicted permease